MEYKCHCKKSKCVKKYCECFAAGKNCQEHCTCHDCQNGKPMNLTNKRRTRSSQRDIPPPRKKKRGKYRVKLLDDLKLKDEAIERCKEFIQEQHKELERIKGLLQKYIEHDHSLQCMSQLTASGPTSQDDDGGEEVVAGKEDEEDEEEAAFSGKLARGGALMPDSQQTRLLKSTMTLSSLPATPPGKVFGVDGELMPLSQVSDIGDRQGMKNIMTFLKRTESMSSWKRGETDEEEEDELEKDFYKVSNELDELRGFMMARSDGRVLLRDFRLERLRS